MQSCMMQGYRFGHGIAPGQACAEALSFAPGAIPISTSSAAFISMNVLGSFGRYAESQFRKIERSERRNQAIADLLDAIEKSKISDPAEAALFLQSRGVAGSPRGRGTRSKQSIDRSSIGALSPRRPSKPWCAPLSKDGENPWSPFRTGLKNAYNLLRLLHSCLHCLRTGEPLIQVDGALRENLLAVKKQQVPLEDVLERARVLAKEIDALAKESRLPEKPDFTAADDFLKACRRESAKASLALEPLSFVPVKTASAQKELYPTFFPVPLPPDVRPDAVERFLTVRVRNEAFVLVEAPLLDVPRHVVRSEGAESSVRSDRVGPVASEVAEAEDIEDLGLLGRSEPVVERGEGLVGERAVGFRFVPTDPRDREIIPSCRRSVSSPI